MAAARVMPDRVAQVMARLATVMDPELDESVTELGFVTGIELLGEGEVLVGFRLPTYWCAANFAFLMADDMRRAVLTLPWVSQVQVKLDEHMYADAINEGVARGAGFQASFGDAAEHDLEGLRRIFLLKAFQRRQAALLEHLLDAGAAPGALVAMDVEALHGLRTDADAARLVERYLDRRAVVGRGKLAFVDADGSPIPADALPAYLRDLRRVAINAEFNGALCRGLLAARHGEPVAQPIHIVRRPQPAAAP